MYVNLKKHCNYSRPSKEKKKSNNQWKTLINIAESKWRYLSVIAEENVVFRCIAFNLGS